MSQNGHSPLHATMQGLSHICPWQNIGQGYREQLLQCICPQERGGTAGPQG